MRTTIKKEAFFTPFGNSVTTFPPSRGHFRRNSSACYWAVLLRKPSPNVALGFSSPRQARYSRSLGAPLFGSKIVGSTPLGSNEPLFPS